MPTVNMKDMLSHAYRHKYAIGAFDVVSLDFVTGVMAAAENSRSPVILSVAESHFDFFDFELLMASVEAAAKRATVSVSFSYPLRAARRLFAVLFHANGAQHRGQGAEPGEGHLEQVETDEQRQPEPTHVREVDLR